MAKELTATEAAARLGVKKATLYAYVSRGLLRPRKAEDGRTSLFDADEIEDFRSSRRRRTEGELETVISTALTRVRDEGLTIRGRDLVTMVEKGAGFEETVDWLWDGEGESWELPGAVASAVSRVQSAMPPGAPLIDRLRVTVATVSAMDPLRFDASPPGMRTAGRRLMLAMALGLPAAAGGKTSAASAAIAHLLWPRLTPRRPTAVRRQALDAALGLLADHGLASSTFAARVAASVRADPYSIVTAGLGVVGGTLHGAASGAVHRLLEDAHERNDAAQALGELHRRGDAPPGFGHTVYRQGDPRFGALMKRIKEGWLYDARFARVGAVQDLVSRRTELHANVDFALGALTWLAGMASDAGEAIFALSRTAGWIAHGIEEFAEAPLRFRPRARYVGM